MTYIVVIAAVLILLNTYPILVSQDLVFKSKQNSLQSQAAVIASTLAGPEGLSQEGVGRVMEVLGDTGLSRVLVTDPAGVVLYDSSPASGAVGRYALLGEITSSLRGNDTFRSDYTGGAFHSRAATPVVYRGSCAPLGKELLWGKSLDDRACFALLLHTLELLKGEELDVDLYVLGSTQEETHSTGAITAAYGIVPDLCVAVDVTHGDSPDAGKGETFKLGGGPVIGLGPNCTRWMVRRMEDKARELNMDIQREVMSGNSGTNGWPLQVSREGIATAVLSIPLRYMHTPIETVCRRDLEDTAKLLCAFLKGIGKEVPSYD